MSLAPGFVWGAATSAYQIEGAANEAGRGLSIWDTFSHTPGATERGENGDRACDHYHRLGEDLDLLADLGVDAYRFSISWPRVIPDGAGSVNAPGLSFYSDLVDGLIERGITPFPTLYHWDLPQALEDADGWRGRATVDAFVRYAEVCVDALGDRVETWATLNEPWCSAFVGHLHGRHAPGHRDVDEAFIAAHHLLLAHGRAITAMRASFPEGRYGVVLNTLPYLPAPGVTEDDIAPQLTMLDAVGTGLFFGGALDGKYPDLVMETSSALAGIVEPGDLAEVAAPLDWLGVNYYSDTLVEPSDETGYVYPFVNGVSTVPPTNPTDMGWPVTPSGLTEFLVRLDQEYDLPPVYITENGAAYDDPPGADGSIADTRRIEYLDAHIAAVSDAVERGVDVRGFFAWSLMDNFEWSYGYRLRFGLTHVDFDTLERKPRQSFEWYRDRIKRSGANPSTDR